MALESLKENIDMEKRLIKEVLVLNYQINDTYTTAIEKKILERAINSYMKRLRMVNNSIPVLIKSISHLKKIGEGEEKVKDLVKISYTPKSGERVTVTLKKTERESFLRELNLSKTTLRRLKKGKKKTKKKGIVGFRKANWYARLSNKLFLKISNNFFEQGSLKKLNSNLRKSNMSSLVTTYLSITFMTTLLSFFIGIGIFIVLLLLTPKTLLVILRNFLVIIILPIITFISVYFYPYLEAKSIESKIDLELPFVAIHMSAVAGSGIEPTQIFKIIALGEEFKDTKKEFKKIVNQVNVYGYDLITALKNTARETSSSNLSELLNGIATTISSGGSLNEFLDKRAETLLFEYRLEREKKTKSAETFMDIYISIVIAAPMIMMLLLILIAKTGMSIGLSLQQMTIMMLSIVGLINVVFLAFLHLSQPGY